MSLIHCLYASRATKKFSNEELAALLDSTRLANALCSVTGLLLHIDGSFFQILEGPAETVDPLFEHIKADPRHNQVVRVIREAIPARSFAEWTMGYAEIDPLTMSGMMGGSDFFGKNSTMQKLEPGRARKLLEAFARGRWRSEIVSYSPVPRVLA